jgi:hypothetical protein
MKFIGVGQIAIFTVSILTFSVLILFEFTLTNSRQTTLYYIMGQCKTCESASVLAKQYFEKGSYVLIEFGLPDNMTLSNVLKTSYGVELMYGSCGAGTEETDCYNETMYMLLQKKYGDTLYLNARNEAHRINSKLKEVTRLN